MKDEQMPRSALRALSLSQLLLQIRLGESGPATRSAGQDGWRRCGYRAVETKAVDAPGLRVRRLCADAVLDGTTAGTRAAGYCGRRKSRPSNRRAAIRSNFCNVFNAVRLQVQTASVVMGPSITLKKYCSTVPVFPGFDVTASSGARFCHDFMQFLLIRTADRHQSSAAIMAGVPRILQKTLQTGDREGAGGFLFMHCFAEQMGVMRVFCKRGSSHPIR